jgi:hypothetical protein
MMAMHPSMAIIVSHRPIESAGMGAINPMNLDVTCPKCGANTVKGIRWVWLLAAAIFLVGTPMQLLVVAALVPGTGGIRTYDWISAVVMGLVWASFFVGVAATNAPRWRRAKCKHTWR